MQGLEHLTDYFLSKDTRVTHPLFIAQYLLVPVNTIVKQCLLPWMAIERGFQTSPGAKLSEKSEAQDKRQKHT